MAIDQFLGSWKLEKSEGMDELLKAMNVGIVKRKLINSASPTFNIEQDGEKVKFTRKTVVLTREQIIEFGVERTENNPLDGKDVKVTDTMDGDVWITVTDSGVKTSKTIVDGKLILEQSFKGVSCKRTFVRVN